jgi:DMSO/TMAO reductase YedYZ heme-binding membrane subunit
MTNKDFRKLLQLGVYYFLPLGLLIASIAFRFDGEFFEELGRPALNLLIFILFLTPVTQILDWKILKVLMTWRREFGLASFWFFVFHTAGMVYVKRLIEISDYMNPASYLFWGAIAGVGMLILGFTSNDFSVRFLRKKWKRVQYIAIPTLFFAQAHASLADEGTIVPAFLLFGFYLLARMTGLFFCKWRLKSEIT